MKKQVYNMRMFCLVMNGNIGENEKRNEIRLNDE